MPRAKQCQFAIASFLAESGSERKYRCPPPPPGTSPSKENAAARRVWGDRPHTSASRPLQSEPKYEEPEQQ